MQIDGRRLIKNIEDLGKIGLDAQGRRSRTAASDSDKAARDLVCEWMEEAGMRVAVDKIGNLFGIWDSPDNKGEEPFMTGSHIDTVINAGKYDGCLGVLAGIEIVRTLKENGVKPVRPVVVAAFTNEEGDVLLGEETATRLTCWARWSTRAAWTWRMRLRSAVLTGACWVMS